MKVYSTQQIRNIGLAGHGHSGKTSLTAALLFAAGATPRLGRVDDGSTVTDFDEIEISHKVSVYTSLAYAEWRDHKVNLLDTPGSNAFILDARPGLRACDAMLCVVDANQGVGVGTEKVWGYADEYDLPRIIFISKLDKDQTNFEECLAAIKSQLSQNATAFQVPIGAEKNFRGFVDLLTMKAHVFEKDGSGKFTVTDIPDDVRDDAEAARESLIEKVAESDDTSLEKFFAEGTLSDEELRAAIPAAIQSGNLMPVFLGSATLNIGTHALLDAITAFAPSPAARDHFSGTHPDEGSEVVRHITTSEPFAAFVFKTLIDQFNRITLCKIVSGVLKSDSTVYNITRNAMEKLGPVQVVQGKLLDKVAEAYPGDIIALTKLKDTMTGDTFCDKAVPVVFAPVKFPEAAIAFALEPKSRADEDKLSTALAKLLEQDQALRYTRDPQTKEFLLAGSGQLHVEITVERLKKRYGVDVVLHPPKVAYRETFKGRIEVQGRHKKQSGGRGQFGDCKCVFEPAGRGEGFKFIDKIFGGSIPQNFRPAIEKGILEAAENGALAGYPMVDFQVELIDGSYHTVDSDELSFKMAGRKAYRAAMEKAKLVLLEPVMHVEVVAPNEFYGDIIGDLNTRRGRIEDSETKGSQVVVKAYVPLSEMLNYAPRLNSITGARGSYTMEFARYDESPASIVQKVVAESQASGRLKVAAED
ncbi:MAG: elongation factor G [Blastocatellia bacterium]|nr:elongation factor G [Blastocatellia bacterium]